MFRFSSDFLKSKTTWTGLFTIALTGYQAYRGQLDLNSAYVIVAGAFATIFHRDTVQKGIERESAERLKIVAAAQSAPPSVPIADAMAAHTAIYTDGVKVAVAGAVADVLTSLFFHNGIAPPVAVEPDGEADASD